MMVWLSGSCTNRVCEKRELHGFVAAKLETISGQGKWREKSIPDALLRNLKRSVRLFPSGVKSTLTRWSKHAKTIPCLHNVLHNFKSSPTLRQGQKSRDHIDTYRKRRLS